MKKKRRVLLPILLGLVAAAIIAAIVVPVTAATLSNNYKRDALIAFSYAQYNESLYAAGEDTICQIAADNVTALYQQVTAGAPMPALIVKGDKTRAIRLDLGAENTLVILPTDDNGRIYTTLTYQGKTGSFVVTGNTSFLLIQRITSPAGLHAENIVLED